MTNYLLVAGGQLQGGYPWSIHAVASGTNSESATETAWENGWAAIMGDTTLKTFYPTGTELTYTYTSTADASFRQTTVTQTNATYAGTAVTASLPFQASPIVTLRTASHTRWGRGRWYLPAPCVGAMATTGPYLSTAFASALDAALQNAFAAWYASFTLQILHKKGTKSGPGPMTLTPVTACDTSNKLAVQRRRGDKYVPIRTSVTI